MLCFPGRNSLKIAAIFLWYDINVDLKELFVLLSSLLIIFLLWPGSFLEIGYLQYRTEDFSCTWLPPQFWVLGTVYKIIRMDPLWFKLLDPDPNPGGKKYPQK